MLIRLAGVSIEELQVALKYSGLYVQTDEANEDYAEIKAIPEFLLRDEFKDFPKNLGF